MRGYFFVSNWYYIAGVNDENRYFVHPLNAPGTAMRMHESLDELVNWLNRTDQGFSKRVQGDILLQFLMPSKSSWSNNDSEMELPTRTGGTQRVTVALLSNNRDEPSGRPPNVSGFGPIAKKTLKMGNHTLTTSGFIYVLQTQNEDPYVLVLGHEFVLQHPEHGMVEKSIPKEHFALLMGQRGRAFSYSDYSGMMTGFD